VEDFDGQRVLLLHGDTLCTDDVAYQRARRVLRHPLFKPAVAPLPFFIREKIARTLRKKSQAHKKTLSMNIMDVAPNAVRSAFARHKVQTIIHGHTHRPAIHEGESGDEKSRRFVLTDWQREGAAPLQLLQYRERTFTPFPLGEM
jgi:UDP-2,3-diacylglucosamine hydrolase